MNEKQLKEINNPKKNVIQEENIPSEDPDSGKKITEWVMAGLAMGFILAVAGFFVWNKYIQKQKEISDLKFQVENLQNKDNLSEENASGGNSSPGNSVNPASDEYPGWETYTNLEVGYTLRYPSGWTIKETSGKSEITGADVKYVTLDTPDKKYFLYFGLKGKNDSFYISDRTGVGAGDVEEKGAITVLNTNTSVKQLIYKGKIQEIFFGAVGSSTTADGKYIFGASFGSRGNTDGGSGINPDLEYIETAKKILESAALLDKTSASGSSCLPSFTAEEKLDMTNWKTFTNNKYSFNFMYPNDWKIKNSSSDNLILGDEDDAMTFQIKSNMAAFGLENYKLGPEKNVKIACKSTKITTYIADSDADPSFSGNERLVLTSFEKNGTAHTIFFSYKDIGASISSDIWEQFDLILESIKYEQ